MKLLIMRHGESEGNKKGIIQGVSNDYGLTEKGRLQVKKATLLHIEELKHVEKIYTSPFLRAIETAEIVKSTANLVGNIEITDMVEEFNAGILAGCTHKYAKEFFPKEYQIWMARKDLDGIKKAECGKELQARALAFLERFLFCDMNKTYLVVTHAGFLRCLYNTSKGYVRYKPVEVDNACIYEVNPWHDIDYTILKDNKKVTVILIRIRNVKYILKHYKSRLSDCKLDNCKIQNEVAKSVHVPKVYWYGNVNVEHQEYGLKVSQYIRGTHDYHYCNLERAIQCFEYIRKISNSFSNHTEYNAKQSLYSKITGYLQRLKKDKVYRLGQAFIISKNYNRLKSIENSYTLYDLHRENIVFLNEKPTLIDMDSYVYAAYEYQVSSYIVAFLLLNENETSIDEINQFIDYTLQYGYNRKDIIFLMYARIFTGLAYFDLLDEDIEDSNRIVENYWRALNCVNMMNKDIERLEYE